MKDKKFLYYTFYLGLALSIIFVGSDIFIYSVTGTLEWNKIIGTFVAIGITMFLVIKIEKIKDVEKHG